MRITVELAAGFSSAVGSDSGHRDVGDGPLGDGQPDSDHGPTGRPMDMTGLSTEMMPGVQMPRE